MKIFRQVTLPAYHPFLNNKYTAIYYAIIFSKQVVSTCQEEYVEKHHIIPDCFYINNRSNGASPGWLEGNSNDHTNLVECTCKEHFILHWLLTKMVPYKSQPWFKMMKSFSALGRASNGQKRIWTGAQYAKIKHARYLAQKSRPSPLAGKPSGRKGIKTGPHSEERKRKIGISNQGPNPNKKPKTAEDLARRTEICREMTTRRLREGKSRKNFKMSDETRKKLSLAKKGKTCGEKNNMWGRKHRPDSIALMRENRKPRKIKDESYIYNIRDPNGVIYTTSNLFYFAKENDLDSRALRRISKQENQHRHHQGWRVKRQ